MNWARIVGNWKQFSGKIRETMGQAQRRSLGSAINIPAMLKINVLRAPNRFITSSAQGPFCAECEKEFIVNLS